MYNNSTSTNASEYYVIDRTVIHFSYFLTVGVIIILGYICNTLSILVFIKSKALRQSTTGLYLVSLAIADLLFLFGEMLRWLDTGDRIPGYDFLIYSDASCQFVYSLRYSAKLTSSWLTVVITAERFFIIVFPLKASTVCTWKKAIIATIITYVVCFVVGGLASLTIRTLIYEDKLMCGYHGYYKVYNWIVLRVGSLLLPGAIVFFLTIVICVKLLKARAIRTDTLSGTQKQSHSAHKFGRGVEKQLTVMLLAVAVTFLGLRLPYTIMFFINDKQDFTIDPVVWHNMYVAYKVTDLLAALNYAVNFFLYCLSGSIFRRQFLTTMRCKKDVPLAHTAHAQGSISNHAIHGVKSQGSRAVMARGLSRADNCGDMV